MKAPTGRYFGTVIKEVAGSGSESVIILLLLAGADVSVQAPENSGTAIQAVAKSGTEAILRYLLEPSVDPKLLTSKVNVFLHHWIRKEFEVGG